MTPKQAERFILWWLAMIGIATLILTLLSSCTSKVYLTSEAYIVGIHSNYIEVRFNCANVRRPDCYAILEIDKEELGEVSIGQKLKMQNPD
jgi:hypothetical protein